MDNMTRPRNRKFGPYICIKLMGSGGQSAVYSAMHEATGRMVALRAMTVTVKNVEAALAECKHVLHDIASIEAPHLVQIEDYGNDGDVLYIAMNVMYGGSLYERMKQRGLDGNPETHVALPSTGEVLQIVERIAIALEDLHSKDIVHGQISPSSILFNGEGDAFLADVGFTKLMKIIYKLEATNSFNMTQYSAPELWNGERPSAATDQYAFACVVYELLTGQPVFDAPSIFGLMQAHANNVATPPHYIRPELPQALSMVFWQALAKPTKKRYNNMMSFYKGLLATIGGEVGEPTRFSTFQLK